MAHYSKIERIISNDKKFNQLSDDAQLIFFRLLVHPHLTVIGAMRGSMAGYASEMRWSLERFQQALKELSAAGMVKVDEEAHFLWFPNFLKYNTPESPNVVKSWGKALHYLPECYLKSALMVQVKAFIHQLPISFQEALPDAFSQATLESLREGLNEKSQSLSEAFPGCSKSLFKEGNSASEGAIFSSLLKDPLESSESLREGVTQNSESLTEETFVAFNAVQGGGVKADGSKAGEGELYSSQSLSEAFPKLSESLREPVTITETVTEAVTEEPIVEPARRGGVSASPDVLFIFNHWKNTFQHPQAVLDEKRKAWISRALKSGYSVDQLCKAIEGCSVTPHNQGHNERGQRYDGLHVILKDADQIDRFIQNAQSPPKPRSAADLQIEANIATHQRWLNKKLFEPSEDSHAEK